MATTRERRPASDIDARDLDALRGASAEPGPFVALLRWAPVFAALGLLAQIGLRGVKPALAEQRALRAKEAELAEREALIGDRARDTSERLEASDDPIYRERLRRLELAERVRELEALGVDPRQEIPALGADRTSDEERRR